MSPLPAASPTGVRVAAPHAALRAHVQAYVEIGGLVGGVFPVAAVPSAFLFVTWGGPVRILTASSAALPLATLFGVCSRAHRSEVAATSQGFHVRFTATGARALLRDRPDADAWHDALPAAVQRWAEATAEAPTFAARVALADAFWRTRLPARDVWSDAAIALVQAGAGRLHVAGVADLLGVSRRTLQRRFADDIGIGLKTFAQVERYRQAHGLLLRTPGATWRDACAHFGYADQAHFVRSFARFAGVPPTRWTPGGSVFDLGFGLGADAG
jgi:AraC-like DNA-binding protein